MGSLVGLGNFGEPSQELDRTRLTHVKVQCAKNTDFHLYYLGSLNGIGAEVDPVLWNLFHNYSLFFVLIRETIGELEGVLASFANALKLSGTTKLNSKNVNFL